MNTRKYILVALLLLATLAFIQATPDKRPTQSRADADLVVVGKVHDLDFTRHDYGREGIHDRYVAAVVVTAVERGTGTLIGEKLNIHWTVVRTRGHEKGSDGRYVYRMKADDFVRFWLMRDGEDWKIIDHPDGIENLTER